MFNLTKKKFDPEILKIIQQSAEFSEYDSIEKRLKTFDPWPYEYFMPKKTLAYCGFFSVNKSNDSCRCYACGGEIRNFEPLENPFFLHSLFFPACKYINYIVGNDFVKESLKVKDKDSDYLRCKICMDRQINIMLLPCKHVVSCDFCTKRIGHCPICRTPILKEEIVFLS